MKPDTMEEELLLVLEHIQAQIDAYNDDDSGSITFAEYFFDNGLDAEVNAVIAKAKGKMSTDAEGTRQ